jgi:hypothetical protein
VQGYQNLREGLGMDFHEDPFDYPTGSTTWTTDVTFELDLAEKLDLDYVRLNLGPPGGSPGFRPIEKKDVTCRLEVEADEMNIDEWGVIRKWTPHERGGYYEMIGYPLFDATSAPIEEGLKLLEDYPWPDPYDEACWADSPMPGMTLRACAPAWAWADGGGNLR